MILKLQDTQVFNFLKNKKKWFYLQNTQSYLQKHQYFVRNSGFNKYEKQYRFFSKVNTHKHLA